MTPNYRDLLQVFGRIGLLSFGGPAAQIGLMHREIVERKNWLSEEEYLRALSFCMLLPGPEAMQLVTYAGWKLKGSLGGLIAGVLFVLPGAFIILALALAYAAWSDLAWMQAVFLGIQSCVVAIVIRALWTIAKKTLDHLVKVIIAGAAFLSIFAFGVPFPAVLLVAAILSCIALPRKSLQSAVLSAPAFPWRAAITWFLIWAAPVAFAVALDPDFYGELALFFSKLAVVTFGGAYAVLAYMTQTVVADFGWISTQEMIDALGLAETTPGPLILVTEFVGALAGFKLGGVTTAILSAALVLTVTFAPCFLFVFVGAPYIEWLASKSVLQSALSGVMAAVVGVILNLSLWFAAHVFFDEIGAIPIWQNGPALLWPEFDSLNFLALAIAIASALILRLSVPIISVIAVSGLLGLATLLV